MEANDTGRALLRGTLRKDICAYIQEQIARGRFRAGDRIVETQLARELRVSQAPVREAILELAAMGLLEERPYSGSFVRRLTAADIEDIYNTRAFIDQHAARLAAKRITQEELAALAGFLAEMERAEDTRAFVDADIAFHAAIIDAAGSPALKRVWDSLRLVEWTGLSAAVTQNSREELTRQHQRIHLLLERRDADAAGAYLFLHIRDFGEEMKRYFASGAGFTERMIP